MSREEVAAPACWPHFYGDDGAASYFEVFRAGFAFEIDFSPRDIFT